MLSEQIYDAFHEQIGALKDGGAMRGGRLATTGLGGGFGGGPGGAPVAVNLVWLVAHTTVRGKGTDAWPVMHAPRPRAVLPVLTPSLPVSDLSMPRLDAPAA